MGLPESRRSRRRTGSTLPIRRYRRNEFSTTGESCCLGGCRGSVPLLETTIDVGGAGSGKFAADESEVQRGTDVGVGPLCNFSISAAPTPVAPPASDFAPQVGSRISQYPRSNFLRLQKESLPLT